MKKAEKRKSEEEWKACLSPEEYRILREKGTEPPFTSKYLYNKEKGVYICAGCGNELFSSETKFESGTGWPSFHAPLDKAVGMKEDTGHGMQRTEVICSICKSHLGHVFDDGPTGKRFCINSLALRFKKEMTGDFEPFLENNKIWHELIRKRDTSSSEAQSTVISLSDIVKSLLFKAGNDFCLVIVQGSKKVSAKKLRSLLNEDNIRLASPEDVLEITGYEVGAVPPIGLKNKVKCIIDASVAGKKEVWAGGGSKDKLVRLKVEDIVKYHNPRIEVVSE